MKKFLLTVSVIFLSLSCDKIDNPIKAVGAKCGDCQESPQDTFITQQNVLIEEFTGVKCNNCPTAAAEGKRLQDLHPNQVFVLGIHAGNFAVPDANEGYPDDFRTAEGDEIYNFANPAGVPSGLINRVDYGDPLFAKFLQQWENDINDILQRSEAPLGMMSTLSINTDSTELCMEVKIKALEDLSARNLYWAAFLAESNIVAPQKLPDNSKDPDYIHNHVLRKGFTSAFGEPVSDFEFIGEIDEIGCTSRSLSLDSTWVVAELNMLVYVYDYDTKEILQVIETHL